MLEILIPGFLLGVLVVCAVYTHQERKQHQLSLAAIQAAVPKLAQAIAEAKFEQHRILQRMMAEGGASSVSLQRRVIHIQRQGTVSLNCHRHSQLMWLRWEFDTDEPKLLDFWQLGRDRKIILTAEKSSIPAWATGGTPSCIKKSAALWRISTGDRIAYVSSWKFEGDGGEIVNIYEADTDALVVLSEEDNEPQLSHVDDSPQAVNQARAAFAAAKTFGPPRTMAVDSSRWDLGA